MNEILLKGLAQLLGSLIGVVLVVGIITIVERLKND